MIKNQSKAQQKCTINLGFTEREKGWFASRCLIGFAFDVAGFTFARQQNTNFPPAMHSHVLHCYYLPTYIRRPPLVNFLSCHTSFPQGCFLLVARHGLLWLLIY